MLQPKTKETNEDAVGVIYDTNSTPLKQSTRRKSDTE
jgi:hypothetical protein